MTVETKSLPDVTSLIPLDNDYDLPRLFPDCSLVFVLFLIKGRM